MHRDIFHFLACGCCCCCFYFNGKRITAEWDKRNEMIVWKNWLIKSMDMILITESDLIIARSESHYHSTTTTIVTTLNEIAFENDFKREIMNFFNLVESAAQSYRMCIWMPRFKWIFRLFICFDSHNCFLAFFGFLLQLKSTEWKLSIVAISFRCFTEELSHFHYNDEPRGAAHRVESFDKNWPGHMLSSSFSVVLSRFANISCKVYAARWLSFRNGIQTMLSLMSTMISLLDYSNWMILPSDSRFSNNAFRQRSSRHAVSLK